MVDFWEVFGRMLTNDDFRKDLFGTCPDTPYPSGIEVPGFNNLGLDIPYEEYKAARGVVATVMTDAPVSLMTLGELLMVLSCPHFRVLAKDLARKIKDTGVDATDRNKLFYIALGCMMLDPQVMSAFAGGGFNHIQFGGLSNPERDDLKKLTRDPVPQAAVDACAEFWGTACTDYYEYYPPQGPLKLQTAAVGKSELQQTKHLHPIVQPYPPKDCCCPAAKPKPGSDEVARRERT
jgi:hypothetical protein